MLKLQLLYTETSEGNEIVISFSTVYRTSRSCCGILKSVQAFEFLILSVQNILLIFKENFFKCY